MNAKTSKFCIVCKNAGKTKEEYTSHYVRETSDVNSKVTCPTLLATKCMNCSEYGHTTKYCKNPRIKKTYEKFCIVCKKAGKSEEEYTSHFVRASKEPDAEIVCPTLLNVCCEYCSEYGHTSSYCEVLKADKVKEEREKEELLKQSLTEQTNKVITRETKNIDEYIVYLERKCSHRLLTSEELRGRDGYLWCEL